MAEIFVYALVEWSIRILALAAVVGALLFALRIKDAHLKLNAWTIVLIAALLMPCARMVTPNLTIPVPKFMLEKRTDTKPAQPAFHVPPIHAEFSAAPHEIRVHWTDVAAGLWLLISSIMLLRLMLGLRLAARLVRRSTMIEDDVRESDLVRVPITVGIVRPVVILPVDWRDWPERKLRAVLAHERAHVARRDPLRQLAASIFRSVAWFHPLAWWLRARLIQLAEEASDDAAIAAAEDRVKYAEALLSFIERTPQRVQWEGVPMANRQTRMRRIDRVLDQTRRLSRPSSKGVLAGMLLAALPLVYITTATRPVWAQQPAAPAPQIGYVCGGSTAFANWLTEDVAYIITNQERQAFVRLGSEAECTMFVEQFWLRRDPTPGTPQNEAREEHYRRIAFANEHFASTVPGWSTDRGRAYITYGPPDEIDSHSAGADRSDTNGAPFEEWLYQNHTALGNVLFRFVDSSMNHEYRLVYMGDVSGKNTGPGGPSVFGPISGLYVQVNANRTVFVTTPVQGDSIAVHGAIVDRNGATVESFGDVSRSAIYGKWIASPLSPGQYTLNLQVDKDRRAISFEVK